MLCTYSSLRLYIFHVDEFILTTHILSPTCKYSNQGVGGLYGDSPLMGTAGADLAAKVATVAGPVVKAAADAVAAAPK